MIEIQLKKRLFSFVLDIELNLGSNCLHSFYGPSGAGKTTLLRLIAGLDEPEGGFIRVDGIQWYSSENKLSLPTRLRQIGYVFQDYALFPNMSVGKNVEFALSPKKNSKKIVDELLDMVKLKEYKNQKISVLSGGQKQRLALIRAIARKPKLLLLDEPLSALDLPMRLALQDEILFIKQRFNITVIMVSHEISEVAKLSDFIHVIKDGKIINSNQAKAIFNLDDSKVNLFGTVIDKQLSDVVVVLRVALGNNIISFMTSKSSHEILNIGDRVMISSKASSFNITKAPSF